MPVLRTRNAAPTVASDVLNLPPEFPDVPDDLLKRFPSLSGWQEEVGNFWTRTKQVLNEGAQSVSNRVNTANTNNGNIRSIAAGLEAQIITEKIARIAGDTALAATISTVSAAVGTKARITVSTIAPGSPSINDLWLDTGDSNRYKFWDGTVWQYKQDLVLAAAVSTESVARATADGFLSGMYTLTVVAGNVVTGMQITSSTGGGATVSSVIFRATDFKIYNGVTGVTMFTVSGATVNLAGTLTVSTAGKVYIGAGTYADAATQWYVDSSGFFSLGDQLTWDGSTLSISGGAVTTVSWTTQVTSRPTELTDGRIPIALSAAGLVVSGVIPGINVTTGAAGLYLGADFMGYYNGAAWRTYMDNAGNFYLGGTSGALQWNGTTLSITGNVVITGGNAAKIDFSNVTAGYAGSPTSGGAANTIVGQGALATLSSVTWGSQVSGRPTELTDGRIATALNSAGLVVSGVKPGIIVSPGGVAGLYLGSDFLGYFNGSAWRTYMDSSGNFFLGGTSGALQWNGTTLTITGVINVTSITGVNYAGAASPGAAATSIVGQGSLATQSSVAYATQVTGAPINASTGALNLGTSPSGSGLFLGSDHLGYYASGAWKTYMDSSGNFYLGGTSGSLQWNGTTLTIVGDGTFTGQVNATSGYFGTGSGVVSITSSGLDIGTSGHILGGQSAYNTGTGFWLGYSSGYKFSIGNASSSYLTWDGTTLAATGMQVAGGGGIFGGSGDFVWSAGTDGFRVGNVLLGPNIYLHNNGAGATELLVIDIPGVSYAEYRASSLTFSGDTNLYRSAADTLKTDDDLVVVGDIISSGAIQQISTDGWTPRLYTGDPGTGGDFIQFQASGGQIFGRINGGAAILLG